MGRKERGWQRKRAKGKRTTRILCICALRREASRAKRRGNAKAEAARRSFAKERRYYHNNGQSHHLFPRSDALRRCSIFPLERYLGKNRVSPPNSRGVYIYKFKMIIFSVGVANRGHLRPFSVGVVPLSGTLSTAQGAMATAAAAVADRPIMPFVKTGHGVSRLSDARNSRASLLELETQEKKYRARGIRRISPHV